MGSLGYPAWNLIRFDRNASEPLYEQLFGQIRSLVLRGQIKRGARLPPSRPMARELEVSRTTVVLAYEKLASEGYVSRRVGVGTFVETLLPDDHRPQGAGAPRRVDHGRHGLSRRGQALRSADIPPERAPGSLFSPGVPALADFPYDVFARIANRHWRTHATAHTGYDFARGTADLSRQLAIYLGESRGIVCRPEQVLVLGSTVQAASLVAATLLDPGEVVLVEDPGHLTQVAALGAWGLKVRPFPVDSDGFDIRQADTRALHSRLAVVTPVEQFPFGCTMSNVRRAALLDWVRSRGGWILEDDYNSEIRWSGRGQPALVTHEPERVIYASSLNRVLAPGLRLAYVVVPDGLVEAFGRAQRALAFYAPIADQALVAEFMAQGRLASHLRRMRGIYRERAGLLSSGLREALGGRFEVPDIKAGLHLTIRAREPMADGAGSDALAARGYDCPALSRYYLGASVRHGFVLGFGNHRPDRIGPALDTFCRIVGAHL